MRLPLALSLRALSAPVLALAVASGWGADAPDGKGVQVRTVVLFSSGVGYFEHAGVVDGSASTELRFKTAQINDILKSLLLEDLDGGKIGTVEYPSFDPLDKTLKSFQVDVTGNPSLAQLLAQLRGAKVTVLIDADKLSGIVLGVEKRTIALGDKGNQTTEVWVLNLLTGASVRQIRLDEVHGLTLDDQQLQDELGKALAALTQARDQDKKPVVIHFDGQGQRHVRLGYVVETPVWKTSYRLVMPAKAGDKGAIQGWAIVENQTDNDWTDVKLSLVSGRPISFIEDLSQPLYVPRPTVEPELYASLRPQSYGGGMQVGQQQEQAAAKDGAANREVRMAMRKAAPAPSAAAGIMAMDRAGESDELKSIAPINATRSIQAAAAAEKLGELFQYTVPKVTLPRQRSAMLPIVTDPVEVERVSIFNVTALASHPLNGALITNTTGKHLLQGPVTVLDGGGYAGDATIDNLPPGDHRLISYAIDIPVKVDATSQTEEHRIVTAKIVDGVLSLSVRRQATQVYQFDNGADDDRTIVVEHQFRQGWKLSETPEPFEKTPQLYRWKVAVAAHKTVKHTVKEELVQWESMGVADLDLPTLDIYMRDGAIPQPVKDALGKAAALRRDLAELQRQIDARQAELNQIAQDQNRLRENMRTVNQSSQYYQRLLAKLNDQETQVEAKQTELDKARAALEAKRKELIDTVAHLNVQ